MTESVKLVAELAHRITPDGAEATVSHDGVIRVKGQAMTDGDALLAAIRAEPERDDLRLIFADYLDEHGQGERAELIRVQCDLAKLDGGERCPVCDWPYRVGEGCEPGNCSFRPAEHTDEYRRWKERQTAYHDLRRREQDLWENGVVQWFPPSKELCFALREGEECNQPAHGFPRRGFIDSVTCPAAAWLAYGDAILAAHPVRTVRLTDRPRVSGYWNDDGGGYLQGCPRRVSLPATEGLTVPYAGDGRNYATRRIPTAEELLSHGWPGVAFELPAETWGNGMPMIPATPFMSEEESAVLFGDSFLPAPARGRMTINGQSFRILDWTMDPPSIVIDGNPDCDQPQGVIHHADPTGDAPLQRTTRRDSIPARWQPRFPRPR